MDNKPDLQLNMNTPAPLYIPPLQHNHDIKFHGGLNEECVFKQHTLPSTYHTSMEITEEAEHVL